MSGTRIPLDLGLPLIVASQELVWGPQKFVRGDAFPWRELGLSDLDVLQLSTDAAPGEKHTLRLDDGRTVVATAGERIDVRTPQQRKQQRPSR